MHMLQTYFQMSPILLVIILLIMAINEKTMNTSVLS